MIETLAMIAVCFVASIGLVLLIIRQAYRNTMKTLIETAKAPNND